ncbi:hypothetical protein [Arthrobacter sp. D3-16]
MSEPTLGKPGYGWFEIRIEGHLEPRWVAWCGADQLEKADDGTTILRGQMTDQTQLHGLLQKSWTWACRWFLSSTSITNPHRSRTLEGLRSLRGHQKRLAPVRKHPNGGTSINVRTTL